MVESAGVPGQDQRGGDGGVDSAWWLKGRDEIGSGLVGDLLYPRQVVVPEGHFLILVEAEGSIEPADCLVFEVAQAFPIAGGSKHVQGEMVLTPGQHLPRSCIEF